MMYANLTSLFRLILCYLIIEEIASRVEFTNVKCISMDKEFAGIGVCRLKSINRTYKYISLTLNLYKTPITKAKINFGVYKRLSGYKPFLYNQSVDACRFLDYQKSNPVAKYLYGFLEHYSNLNHSCPYNHDLILNKLSTEFANHRLTKILPVPEGDYMLETHWILNGKFCALYQIYFSLT
ncbi:uncharacterized protein LOC108097817 [Drosophila ficusphila]|uniref:uncharacterized protein LOC108097817 n=1 Tax=Drosophila ficusphila TaxID=30025 RepID=UPI0007E82CB4|nr:uncharacterized protein LOC108097817 [Drosophila ficusphila]